MADVSYFEGDGPKIGECSDCKWFVRKQDTPFGNCLLINPPIPIHPGPLVADDQWCDFFEADI